MRTISQITCSLNLGFVYSFDYSYNPKSGITMRVEFVREDGSVANYQVPKLPQKCFIQVGSASFGMYPVRAGISLGPGRRVQWVEFVDDFFRLSKYYVALPGRGCGLNVFNLGTPVDNRTEAQKVASAPDPIAQQIKALTQFPDYEYTFNQFLTLLRTRFSVSVNATFIGTITQAYEGSFQEVLDSWCQYYNLSYFFENGTIKIFDPTRLTISLPALGSDMITYESENDITSTYGKTVCNWFQQDGGEYPLSQTSDSSGPLQVTTDTLYPVGYEFGLTQNQMDLHQVAASMYGINYWFLYNYYKGTTADQCGWTPVSLDSIPGTSTALTSAKQSVAKNGVSIVTQVPGVMEQRFQAYQQYGNDIAGRWYLSNREDDISKSQAYTWFNETQGQITNFTGAGDKLINLSYLTPEGGGAGVIDGTFINPYYSGINYFGNRIVYRDDYASNIAGTFVLASGVQNLVDTTYAALTNIGGSNSMDFSAISSALNNAQIVAYNPNTPIPQDVSLSFLDVDNNGFQFTGFQPRFSSVPIKGIRTIDYQTLQGSQSSPTNINIVNGNAGPNVVTNTSVLKTEQQGSYTVYYDKYLKCASASSADDYYDFRFDPRQVSIDNEISITFKKLSNNTYNLQRDYGVISALVNNPFLPTLAQARTFSTQKVTFTTNYFYEVPVNFLTNGLVGLSVTVSDNGISASYSFSNEMLQVPDATYRFNQYAQAVKNSWIRTYNPKELLT